MFKGWTGWMIKSIIGVLIISSVTVFTTWKVTEWYMKRYVDKLGVPEHVQRMEVGELLALLSDVNSATSNDDLSPIERITQESELPPITKPQDKRDAPSGDGLDATATAQDEGLSSEQEVNPDGTGEADNTDITDDAEEANEAGEDMLPDAVPVFGTDLIEEENQMPEEFAMSTEQFVAMQDQLSTEDKSAIFTILFSKVPQHEFQQLSFILEEGITAEESLEIARILQQYLSEDELQELTDIIQKYE